MAIWVATMILIVGVVCFIWLTSPSRSEPTIIMKTKGECDHVYWPVVDDHGEYIGQRCGICGQFNTIEEVLRDS